LELIAAGMPVDPRFPSDMGALGIAFVPVDLDTIAMTSYPRTIALPDSSVDVVICTEMIEHLYSVRPFFEEVTRVLKPSGVLFVDTNNVAYLLGILRLLKGETNLDVAPEHTSALAESEWRGHVRFYSLRQLRELAKRYGMSVPASGYFQLRAPRVMVAPAAMRRWLVSRVFDVLITPFPVYQSHIWMTAQKPKV
jgi:SAM-dependent methyltransferase